MYTRIIFLSTDYLILLFKTNVQGQFINPQKKNDFVSIHRMSGGGIPLGNVESQSPSNPDIPASHGYNEDF